MGKASLASITSTLGSLVVQRPRTMATVACLSDFEVAPCGNRRLEPELVKWIVAAMWEILYSPGSL